MAHAVAARKEDKGGLPTNAASPTNSTSSGTPSPTHFGRDRLTLSVDDLSYAVPESPNRRSVGDKNLPFPSATHEDRRHQVDDKSLEPWRYLMSLPGKNVRDQLIDAFQAWFQVEDDSLVLIKQIVGFLHSASLIVDDIEDHSDKRRGFDAAHIKFGVDKSLNAANYVYFLALEKVLTLQSTKAVEVFTSEMLNLHRGQGCDIWWRVDGRVPSVAEYDQMVKDKTGGLFRLAVKLMGCMSSSTSSPDVRSFALSNDSDAAVPWSPLGAGETQAGGRARTTTLSPKDALHYQVELCNALAVFFQIRDDVINIASPVFHEKKGFAEDITEGKLSFPVIYTVFKLGGDADPDVRAKATELLTILRLQTLDVNKKKRAIAILCEAGAIEATLERLASIRQVLDKLVADLGGNPALTKIIAVLWSDLDDCHHTMERVVNAPDTAAAP